MRGLRHVPPRLVGLADELAALPVEPLLVRCTTPEGYIPAEPDGSLHLDSLLGWAVLQAHHEPVWWPDDSAAVIPVPLARLWVSPGGLPLWAASTLRPADANTPRAHGHWHKRYPLDRVDWAKRKTANLSAGRWKEYRVPVTTWHPDELRAVCIGHRETVAALLDQVTHVGKKGAAGYGRVGVWAVEPWPMTTGEATAAILKARPVPVACLGERGAAADASAVRVAGWSPPYWYRPWHAPVVAP